MPQYIVLRFIELHRCIFYKLKARLHQQKDYGSLYGEIRFITVVWTQTCNISEVRLYTQKVNSYRWVEGLQMIFLQKISCYEHGLL